MVLFYGILWNFLKVYIVISDFMDVHGIRSERVLSSIHIDTRSLGIELTIHIVFVPRVSFMHVLILVVCHSCFCVYFWCAMSNEFAVNCWSCLLFGDLS